MKDSYRIIKMTNEGVYITPTDIIPYAKTNLNKNHFTFKQNEQIYWLVDLSIQNTGKESAINVHIIDYIPKNTNYFSTQKLKRELEKLEFQGIDYEKAIKQFSSYSPNKLTFPFFNLPEKPDLVPKKQLKLDYSGDYKRFGIFEPIVKELKTLYKVKFTDATIIEQGIKFSIFIVEFAQNIEFTIANVSLRSEFELIKEYITKKLKRQYFTANCVVKQVDWKIESAIATSDEIDEINEDFFRIIRSSQIKSLTKVVSPDSQKGMYSIAELVSQSEQINNNIFNITISDIIQILTNNGQHRNSKQIEYLTSRHDVENEIIHITTNPLFGFVFYLSKNQKHYFVWELLDSHATYIWGFSNTYFTLKRAVDAVSSEISNIQLIGRNEYRKSHSINDSERSFSFYLIEHVAISRNETDLELWMSKIDHCISI